MIPVVTPEEMRAIDAAAPEPVDVLVERAGWAVYRMAMEMLGGSYGRRVVVVAGKGNNGADGRAAGRRLEAHGVRVEVTDAAHAPAELSDCDLVIDAAYGTGFRGEYLPPEPPAGALVLAVDVPSGPAVVADATVTFAAMKPSLVYADPRAVGVVTVADIGLDVSSARAYVVEPGDVWLPGREWNGHKYDAAVLVVAGSPGMTGAPVLCARSAMRAGSGYVRLLTPGVDVEAGEAVAVRVPPTGWAEDALKACDRMKAVALGPGLGPGAAGDAKRLAIEAPLPAVVDGDGLNSLARIDRPLAWQGPRVLTPHDGEFARLAGCAPGEDRIAATRELASRSGAVVLLKGSTTTVAAPDGRVLFARTGGPRLATAGTGDVLSGVIAAFLARGLPALEAAAFGAHVHGLAALGGHRRGLVAGDLPDLIPAVLP